MILTAIYRKVYIYIYHKFKNERKMIRYSIVGCGLISNSHLTAAKRLEKEGLLKIVACVDTIEEKAKAQADKFGGKPYKDLDEMLKEEKPDVVDVCTWDEFHRDVAVKAMEAGADVITEKTIANTVEEALDMIKASEKTGKRLMVSYNYRFLLHSIKLHEFIENGDLGDIRLVVAACHWNQGTHTIDLMRYFGGEVAEVSGAEFTEDKGLVNLWNNKRYGPVVTTAACLRYENNALGTLTITSYPEWEGGYFKLDVIGSKKRALIIGWRSLTIYDRGKPQEIDVTEKDPNDWFYRDLRSFIESVRDNKPVPISGLDGLRALQIQIAIHLSAIEGKWIDPKTIRSGTQYTWRLPNGKETTWKEY
jgi:predicted dehydrogenase